MKRCHRMPSTLLMLIIACCVFSSCVAGRQSPAPPATAIDWEDRTPRDVLAALRAEQEKITSLTAAFSLSVDPPPKGRPSHMQGVMFFSTAGANPRVRIQCLGFLGRILFDMVLKDGAVELYVPSRRTMFTGRADRAGAGNAWQDVMSAMLFDISEASLPEDVPLSFEKDMVLLRLKNGELRLDRANGLIRQWRQAETITSYDRYTAHTPGLPPLPEHIEIQAVDGSRRAVFMLSQPNLNKVPDDVFDLSDYTPEAVRDFSELEKQVTE